MESVLKKFEKQSIDMSKIYGGEEFYSGRGSVGTSGGAIYHGEEYTRIDDQGCVVMFVVTSSGIFYQDMQC
jgi:hypothetical protein